MANSGFQHLRFLQIVGRGRWWAHINCQRFLCLVWKLYSMYPGRASALSAPGDPWPVLCHWVLTAGSQSPPAAPPAFCCPLDVTCLTLGVLTWFFTAQHGSRRIATGIAHQSGSSPSGWVYCLGILGSVWTTDHSRTIWLLIWKTPQKHLQGKQDLPLCSC